MILVVPVVVVVSVVVILVVVVGVASIVSVARWFSHCRNYPRHMSGAPGVPALGQTRGYVAVCSAAHSLQAPVVLRLRVPLLATSARASRTQLLRAALL